MKLAAVCVASIAIIVAAFIVLPKLLLNVSRNTAQNTNVPLGQARQGAGTPVAGGAAADSGARRFESFSQLQFAAGFTPLTPAALPADYQPWEEYVKSESGGNIVVFSYFKPDGLFVQIYERPHNANDQSGRAFFRGGFQPGEGTGRAGGQGGRPANSPFIDVGGAQGLYAQGALGPGSRQLVDALAPSPRNTQPHRVLAIRNNIEIIVEADLTDVPRDELIQIAAGLR